MEPTNQFDSTCEKVSNSDSCTLLTSMQFGQFSPRNGVAALGAGCTGICAVGRLNFRLLSVRVNGDKASSPFLNRPQNDDVRMKYLEMKCSR